MDLRSEFLLKVDLPTTPPRSLTARDLLDAFTFLNELPVPPWRNKPAELFAEAVQSIGPGMTRTYGQIAAFLHTSPRAIGARCSYNPFLLRIPCHRVTGASSCGGFRAGTLWKAKLLELEKDSSVFQRTEFSGLPPRGI